MQLYKQQDFQERSLHSLQQLGDPQQIVCMTIGGFALLIGPQDRQLVRACSQSAYQIATFLYPIFDIHGLSPQTIKATEPA